MDNTFSIYAVTITINPHNVQTAYTVRPSGAVDAGTEIESGFDSWERAWKRIGEIDQAREHERELESARREQSIESMLRGIQGL